MKVSLSNDEAGIILFQILCDMYEDLLIARVITIDKYISYIAINLCAALFKLLKLFGARGEIFQSVIRVLLRNHVLRESELFYFHLFELYTIVTHIDYKIRV